jgi:hypothetical protein
MALTDLYKILFGKEKIRDGDVISMAEHGRTGGKSDGQGFKFTDTVNYTEIVDKATPTVIYIGRAPVGSDTIPDKADSVWQIMKIDTTASTDIKVPIWADGNENFDNIWDNRASLSYS